MSDLERTETLGGFPPPENEADAEIVVLGPDGKAPGSAETSEKKQVVLTSEEFEALKSRGNEAGAIKDAVNQLGQTLQRPANVATAPQQAPGESDDDFAKRLETELFTTGKTGGALREAIMRYAGPAFQQVLGTVAEQSKKLLEVDVEKGPVFKRYRGEIEEYVGGLSMQQKMNPAVWDHAFETVQRRHSGDLIKEQVDVQVKLQVAEELKRRGITVEERIPAAVGTGQGSAMSAPEVTGTKRRQQILLTQSEKNSLERTAEIRGLDLQTYLTTEQGQEDLRRMKNGK